MTAAMTASRESRTQHGDLKLRGACLRDARVGARSTGDESVQRLAALIAPGGGSHG